MKVLLNTNNLELVNLYIERYYKVINQENVVKIKNLILTSRYFWVLDVHRYLRTKIALKGNITSITSPDPKLNVVFKRWHEFDKEY